MYNSKEKVENIRLQKLIEKIKLNSIDIKIDNENEESIPKGYSKIGGYPDLPKDFKWYYYEGEEYYLDAISKLRPLSFLAQFNCEEFNKYDIENRLPRKGILYFFYVDNEMGF